jgi:hypothetical protein
MQVAWPTDDLAQTYQAWMHPSGWFVPALCLLCSSPCKASVSERSSAWQACSCDPGLRNPACRCMRIWQVLSVALADEDTDSAGRCRARAAGLEVAAWWCQEVARRSQERVATGLSALCSDCLCEKAAQDRRRLRAEAPYDRHHSKKLERF